uniref:F5/8 type C domain-containing protein n=1 Tax=Haptolina brevifila TaxID=156173 RepID=A0A7S2N2F2_9EUKA
MTELNVDVSDSSGDHAFACMGICKGCTDRPWRCGDASCPLKDKPLAKVAVVYVCKGSCAAESALPTICANPGCSRKDELYEAVGLVPPDMVPIPRELSHAVKECTLDPPEEARSYSSVWKDETVGSGHARAKLDSEQAWSAKCNNEEQWMIIDAGGEKSLCGLVLSGRGRSCQNQHVTQVRIDVSSDADTWHPASGGRTFATGLKPQQEDLVGLVLFDEGPLATRYVRIRVVAWKHHISMRCGLLLRIPPGVAGRDSQPGDGGGQAAPVERRDVINTSQLPAQLPATSMPHGAPPAVPPHAEPCYAIARMPTGQCSWAGRQMAWTVEAFNGQRNTNAIAVRPGEACVIEVLCETTWRYNSSDYCPGCIVQLYYGLTDVFSTGVVERGIHGERVRNRTSFTAPMAPGVYYITQQISLQCNPG